MKPEDIKVGQLYNITGTKCGCNNTKCKDCLKSPITVTELLDGGEKVCCYSYKNEQDHCHALICDLTPLTWKEIFKIKEAIKNEFTDI